MSVRHQRRRPVGDQRTVRALQGAGDKGVLVAFGAAEIEAEILAHLGVGVFDAVLVVLGGDAGERVRLVAVFLEIALRDLAENAGKATRRIAVFRQVGRLQQVLADFRRRRRRHLLDTDDQHVARIARGNGAHALMHGGRTRRAGIFHPRRALEAERRVGLQHEGSGEILRRKSGVEMPEHDLVDIARLKACVGDGVAGHRYDHAFDGFIRMLAEGRVRPADDCGGHWLISPKHGYEGSLARIVSPTGPSCKSLVYFPVNTSDISFI